MDHDDRRRPRARPHRRRRAGTLRSAGHRRARRRRLLAWAVVAAVALGVQRTVTSAAEARAAWTGSTTALVVRRPLAAGADVTTADLTTERRPAAVLPTDALAELPAGALAAVRLSPGTVLTPALLDEKERSATARALPTGRVAVVVRTGDLPRLASRGDVVDVAAPTWDGPVATSATVVAVDGDAVTLAVMEDDAAATAAASLAGPVALVVRP
ncbi:SAF domain-containing protein [Dermatobacter hominis]|uniref:SAF domain-containing protein n=1 Tax=Dermatobacter hominis TaxID=2884263 RepID=UPI001D102904|nr:SAF domain-containing protein [Dermatobacter hominis]UDY37879.1 SAF domain-containing protein [Dermatobacter hominis]